MRSARSTSPGSRPLRHQLSQVGAALAAGLLLALAVGTGAANADDEPTGTSEAEARGAERITLSGTPIVGGSAESPTEVTTGDWTDTLPASTDGATSLFYTLKRSADQAKSTLRVSVVALGTSDGAADVSIAALPSDDLETLDACPENDAMTTGNAGIATASIRIQAGQECGDAASYRLEVNGDGPDEGPQAFMLRITEEPVVTSNGSSGTLLNSLGVPPSAEGPTHDVDGALSFSDAPGLKAGRWASSIVPSETRLYRIPLTYGESVRVGVTFDSLSDAQKEALGSDSATISTAIRLLDPMLGALPVPDGALDSDSYGAETLFTGTGTVNRGIESSITGGTTQQAGDYYLAVTVQDEGDVTVVLPFVIDLAVVGDPGTGPTHEGGTPWAVADQVTPVSGGDAVVEGEPKADGSGTAAAATRTTADRLPSIAAGVAGVLFTLIGVTMLVRLRRPRA